MKKHYFKSLLTTILLLCSAVLNAQDISVQYTGFEHQGIYYKFTGGNTVAVGEIYKSGDIEIPERVPCTLDFMEPYYTVTSIGDNAFENETDVTSVKIPKTVTSIGEHAFRECTSLTSITIPNSITHIGYGAFRNSSGLKEVIIEDGEDAIYISESDSKGYPYAYWYAAFASCPLETVYIGRDIKYYGTWYFGEYDVSHFANHGTLKEVVYGNKVTKIRERAFDGCPNLEYVTIPNSITSIGRCAFGGCSSLKEIKIPNTIKRIEDSTFTGCSSLTSITIPNSVDTIEVAAFTGCSGLKEVIIEDGVNGLYMYESEDIYRTLYGTFDHSPLETVYLGRDISYPIPTEGSYREIFSPFSGYNPTLKNVTIGTNVTILPDLLFRNCTGLTSITIPNSVKVIGRSAFENCTGLENITIPNSVTTMNDGANFYGCTGLKSAIIGDGVNDIPGYAFYGCKALEQVKIGSSVRNIGDCSFQNCEALSNVTMGKNATRIGNNAFSDCISLPSITIPNSVTTIGDYSFSCCYALTNITIPNSVTTIGNHAFSSCNALNEVTIGDNVTIIGNHAFGWCYALNSVTMGNGVASMGENAFISCNSLTAVHISDLSAWCKIDFYNNESSPLLYAHNLYVNGELLTDLVIPSDVTEIVNHAFQGCTSITNVTIPEGITRVGVAAFEWCSNLTGELVIPNSVKRIDGWAFSETKLTGIKWGNGLTYIGQCAFNRCYELAGEGLVIPEGVEAIDGDAFNACYNLTGELVIPNSVKTIGGGAFNGCTGFTSVRMGSGVQTIGNDAFGWLGWKAKDVYITDLSAWCKIDFNGSNPLNGGANLHLNGELLTDLVIPDDITEIKPYAFHKCKSINTVDLGNTISIGDYAFYGCDNLIGELVIPNSVTNIGYSVFYGCRNLAGVSIGDGVTVVSNAAFYDCRNLKKITLGKNIETIDMNSNFDRWAVSSVTFNMNTVKDWFREFPEITEVHFGDNVQTITGGAFAHCDIDSVHIPAGVTSIEDYAFSWNQHLRKVTVAPENSVYHIDEEHHVMMETATDKVALAYQGATIPSYATAIGNGAFNGLLGITSLTIPESVESIGEWAFDGCSDLKKVINYSGLLLTKGSTDHGYVAYYADEVINIADIIDGYVFLTVEDVNYLMDYTGEATTLTLPSDFKGESYIIAEGALKNKKAITSITLSDGVTAIADSAFAGCEALEELAISATVERIGKGITAGCNALAIITVDEENPTFDSREGCNAVISNTEYIVTPGVLVDVLVSNGAFTQSNGNKTWHSKWESSVVEGFSLSTSANNMTTSGDYIVGYTGAGRSIYTLTAPEGFVIEGYSFDFANTNGDNSYSITLNIGDKSYASSATTQYVEVYGLGERIVTFTQSGTNRGITFSNFIVNIKPSDSDPVAMVDDMSQRFNTLVLGCKTTVIPESVVVIGDAAFSGVEALQTITIPASVTIIGREAFKGCSNLAEIHVKAATPATIYSNTFADYSATLYVPAGTQSDYQAADYWKNFFNVVSDDETLIEKVNGEETDDVVYDLMGRRVTVPQKGGVYIVNGKKTVIR